MSVRSATAGTMSTLVAVGVLGSPALVDEAQELAARHASPVTAGTLTGFPNWDVFDEVPGDVVGGIILKLTVMVIVVGLLTALAGRASRPAAFLAGWGSLIVAAAIAGAIQYAYQYVTVLDGQNPLPLSYFDNLMGSANAGAAFGLWTGWFLGAAVALVARLPATSRHATGPIARAPGRPLPTETPAPWWAANASPTSPAAVYNPASVFPTPATGNLAVAAAAEAGVAHANGAGANGAHADGKAGTNGDVDINTTLSTPLAKLSDDADATRPIPVVAAPPGASGADEPSDSATDATEVTAADEDDSAAVKAGDKGTVAEAVGDPTVVAADADDTVAADSPSTDSAP